MSEAMRIKMCAHLRAMGVDAQLAPRGRPEEDGLWPELQQSLGLIDIEERSIHWAHVLKDMQGRSGPLYSVDYGVPDPRNLPRLMVVAVRVKTFPLFGRVINIRWKVSQGGNCAKGIAQNLTDDKAVETAIIDTFRFGEELFVAADPERGYWKICTTWGDPLKPSPEQWACYERIAARLLATPISV